MSQSPDNIVFKAVNEIFGALDAKAKHELFLQLRREYQRAGRFHHTYGRMANNIERANGMEWDNRPAAIAAILLEKMTPLPNAGLNGYIISEVLEENGRADLIEAAMAHVMKLGALIHSDKDVAQFRTITDMAVSCKDPELLKEAAVNMVAEQIFSQDFQRASTIFPMHGEPGLGLDIMNAAFEKAKAVKTLRVDNNFPHVSGLHMKIA